MVYKYEPISLNALRSLVFWEFDGEEAQSRRYMCEMLQVMASGKRLNSTLPGTKYYDRITPLFERRSGKSRQEEQSGEDIVRMLLA